MLLLAADLTTGQILSQVLLFGGVILILYFYMYAPQRRKQREQLAFRTSMKEGEIVVTIGGLHGKIHAINEETLTLLVDKNTKLLFDRQAISSEATRRLQQKLYKEVSKDEATLVK